jgi:hypothetical protein
MERGWQKSEGGGMTKIRAGPDGIDLCRRWIML